LGSTCPVSVGILDTARHLYSFTRRARNRKAPARLKDTAREIYDQLVATDPIVRHQWLFARQWVEESWDEIDDEKFDYRKREEKIGKLRADAIAEIWKAAGYDGIVRLCESGESSNVIGWQLAAMSLPDLDPEDYLFRLASEPVTRSPAAINLCIAGYLLRLDDPVRVKLLSALVLRFQAMGKVGEDGVIRVLKDAPFKKTTWALVDALPQDLQDRYWVETNPHNWHTDEAEELRELVDRLLLAKRPKAALSAIRLWIEKLDSPRIARLMREVAITSSPTDENVRFHSYDFAKAFETLDDRADVPTDELAHLEFLYLSGLEHEKRGIPNLARQLATNPALFVQAVGLVYKRKGGDVEDPPEWHVENEKARENVATQAYRLLNAKRIPGTDDGTGKIVLAKLKEWINEVRSQCKSYGREEVGDSCIGELLSKSGPDNDGIWPAVAIRDVLEEVGNEKIAIAMAIGLYNQRGAHFREIDG
jgi:hypothetical protein